MKQVADHHSDTLLVSHVHVDSLEKLWSCTLSLSQSPHDGPQNLCRLFFSRLRLRLRFIQELRSINTHILPINEI